MDAIISEINLLIFLGVFAIVSTSPQATSSVHVSLSSPHHQYSYGFRDGLIHNSDHQGLEGNVFGPGFAPASLQHHVADLSQPRPPDGSFALNFGGIHPEAAFGDFSLINSASNSPSSFASQFDSSLFSSHPSVDHLNELPLEQLLLQHQEQPSLFTSGLSNSIDLQATHSKLDFSQHLAQPAPHDPYLITGDEAKQKVNHLFKKRLFWKDIKHENMLLRNQQERRENGLVDMVLGSNRPSSPFYHGNKYRPHPNQG